MWVMGATVISGLVTTSPQQPLIERYRNTTARFCQRNDQRVRRIIETPTTLLTGFGLASDDTLGERVDTGFTHGLWTGTRFITQLSPEFAPVSTPSSTAQTQTGHFASASLLDGKDVLLTQDASGLCPLYFCLLDQALLFASSLEFLLLCVDDVCINTSAMQTFAEFDTTLSSQTLYQGIQRLAAHQIRISEANQQLQLHALELATSVATNTASDESPLRQRPALTPDMLFTDPAPESQAAAFLELPSHSRAYGMPLRDYWECLLTPALLTQRGRCLQVPMGKALFTDHSEDPFINGPKGNALFSLRRSIPNLQQWLRHDACAQQGSENTIQQERQQLRTLLGHSPSQQEWQAYLAIQHQLPALAQRLSKQARNHGVMLVFPYLQHAHAGLHSGDSQRVKALLKRFKHLNKPALSQHFAYDASSAVNLYDTAQRLLRPHRHTSALRHFFSINALHLSRYFISTRHRTSGEAPALATWLLSFDYLDGLYRFNTQTDDQSSNNQSSNKRKLS